MRALKSTNNFNNTSEGDLGRFFNAVENKFIPKDSWLVVENQDHLSREELMKSQRLFKLIFM